MFEDVARQSLRVEGEKCMIDVFEKGFRIGVQKGMQIRHTDQPKEKV